MTALKVYQITSLSCNKHIDFRSDHSYYVCDIPRRSSSGTECGFDHSSCHIHAEI